MKMFNVTGYVYFDRLRTNNESGLEGMSNVPVVLQSTSEPFNRLTVLTSDNGEYAFSNVPNGEYRIVEAYGETDISSSGDFNDAIPGSIPNAEVPPVSFAPNPPTEATNLDCVTPNTIFINIADADLNGINFLNGPVKYIPINTIMDKCAVIMSENLLADADFGTMGDFPVGTNANTGTANEPYPENTPEFQYVQPLSHPVETPGYPAWYHAPEDGEYTVQNILNDDNSNRIGAWWRIADRTKGNETGRFMIVNGDAPGTVFFTEEVDVKANQYYLFSAWIINLFKVNGWADPKLGVKILGENGQELYKATLGALIPVNTDVPEWKEIGTVINSRDNNKLTVQFLSEGPAEIGNDYAIDDISLKEITVPKFTPVKSIDRPTAYVGETIFYEIVFKNTCTLPLTNIKFLDKLPQGLAFVDGSVTINGTPSPSSNPETGFDLPNLSGGEEVTVRFEALVESAEYSPAKNTAEINYDYTPVEGGILTNYDVNSNEVILNILKGDTEMKIIMTKIALGAALEGGEFTFAIFDESGKELYTATNDVKGLITFPDLQFDRAGQFNYTVKEIHAPSDWEKDDSEWQIKITVTEVKGELHATLTYPNGVPVFINKHQSATCGEFKFPDLTFNKPGIYEYTLKELTTSGGGWTTDDRIIRVIITVTDDGFGHLVATVEYPDGFPSFTNIYHAEPTHAIISGCKIAIGAPLPPGYFEFGLFDSDGKLIATATNGLAQESDRG